MTDIIIHPFPPVYSTSSFILILGSFPSVKSREEGFYYGYMRNRFWPMLERIYNEKAESTEDADSSISDAIPNDIPSLLENTKIKRIITNGRKAYSIYMKYIYEKTGIEPVCLPSTSPANAAWSLDDLIKVWREALSL